MSHHRMQASRQPVSDTWSGPQEPFRPTAAVASRAMDPEAIKRAQDRINQAAAGRVEPAALDAALERAREQVEALAATAGELEATLPSRGGHAVEDGLRAQVLPVGRNPAEIPG